MVFYDLSGLFFSFRKESMFLIKFKKLKKHKIEISITKNINKLDQISQFIIHSFS